MKKFLFLENLSFTCGFFKESFVLTSLFSVERFDWTIVIIISMFRY